MSRLEPGKLVHTRTYDIEAHVVDDGHFSLTGRIHDVKPDGLWGVEDPNPMSLHDMTLRMVVRVADLTITEVHTTMSAHPQSECPLILPAYEQLVGVSIARGFTQKVKELFGGPRACTHIGALINAMAPVAMQTLWAFSHLLDESSAAKPAAAEPEEVRRQRMAIAHKRNLNTCHVWAEQGPMFARLNAGEELGPPLWAIDRLAELGVSLEDWRANAM